MDDTKPESVVRLLGGDVSEDARKAAVNKVHAIALGCLGLGGAGLFYAASVMAFGAAANTAYTVLAMLGLAVFGGYAYQGPPFRLSYKGLGEPICFAFSAALRSRSAFCRSSLTPLSDSAYLSS